MFLFVFSLLLKTLLASKIHYSDKSLADIHIHAESFSFVMNMFNQAFFVFDLFTVKIMECNKDYKFTVKIHTRNRSTVAVLF